jgi:predicted LPLAT superfamily acyltransferase
MAVEQKLVPPPSGRNPGPPFGLHLLHLADRWLPGPCQRVALHLGNSIAVALMTKRRAASAAYLEQLRGRPATRQDIHQHFSSFTQSLIQRLRLSRGLRPDFYFHDPEQSQDFEKLCRSPQPALFGTFHVGQSDLLGCMLSDFGRRIALVRHRVGNSLDIDTIEKTFEKWVQILWINQPENFLFDLKQALEQGLSIGLQCDRINFGGRLVALDFLGAKRPFPFTIYHLAKMFDYPVAFAFAGQPDASGNIPVLAPPVFYPGDHVRPLDAAKEHFQQALRMLEDYLLEHPFIWYNFEELNPPEA